TRRRSCDRTELFGVRLVVLREPQATEPGDLLARVQEGAGQAASRLPAPTRQKRSAGLPDRPAANGFEGRGVGGAPGRVLGRLRQAPTGEGRGPVRGGAGSD